MTYKFAPMHSGCTWQATIDGVIYSDGSSEGNAEVVRGMVAHRDGVVAGVAYWSTLLDQRAETPGAPRTGLNNEALAAKAKQRADKEFSNGMAPNCYSSAVCYQYWLGLYHVDLSLSLWGHDLPYTSAVMLMTGWKQKVDADMGLKDLQYMFRLPAELKEAK